jgi:hypothetical protein
LKLRKGFEKDLFVHDEVFDDIRRSPFSLKEAAEYLYRFSKISSEIWKGGISGCSKKTFQ